MCREREGMLRRHCILGRRAAEMLLPSLLQCTGACCVHGLYGRRSGGVMPPPPGCDSCGQPLSVISAATRTHDRLAASLCPGWIG